MTRGLRLSLFIGLLGCIGINIAVSQRFDASSLRQIDLTIEQAVSEHKTPGGVFWLESANHGVYAKPFGNQSLYPQIKPATLDTLYDAASLTKVIATTTCVMQLVERGVLRLEDPVLKYIPTFQGQGKTGVTIRHLLTHLSGLPAGLSLQEDWHGYHEAIRRACKVELTSEPGTRFRYSDINFILLGELVRRASGTDLDEFAQREIFRPLKMRDTGFLPSLSEKFRIAPTTEFKGGMIHGVVHDPTARRMGGVAGHAGLFVTAPDLARFANMLLNRGTLDGVRILSPETVQHMTRVQTPAEVEAKRGLGWDIDSNYSGPRGGLFPVGSFGHTGWTGTSLWIDPASRAFVLFLSNRNHPSEEGTVIALRRTLGTLAAQAVGYSRDGLDLNFQSVSAVVARPIANGIEQLATWKLPKRVGLITNQTGIDRGRRSSVEILLERADVELAALFSPEHGFHGILDEKVKDSVDQRTGLKVYSLYGESRKPTREQLAGLDALLFDIQDIGCRFYTYISTMTLAMEAAAENKVRFVVLDRVNPINGITVDGPVLLGTKDFVGIHEIPVRHGMTVGELARMIRAEKGISVELEIVPCQGWKRSMIFDETGLPWINPSPNMRSLTQALLYPGVGLLETTELSVGRGTDTPFEIVGAPYLDDVHMAAALNAANIEGVTFIPVAFTPNASVYQDTPCRGVNIQLLNREVCPVVDIGLHIAKYMHQHHPNQWTLDKFNRLLKHPPTLEAIREGQSVEAIRDSWRDAHLSFLQRRDRFLISEYQ